MMRNIRSWTVVQHSGYGYNDDFTFRKGLEPRSIQTKLEEKRVLAANGVLFDSYLDADNFCMEQMYPDNYFGMTPQAKGTFSTKKIDGLAIYIPVRVVV